MMIVSAMMIMAMMIIILRLYWQVATIEKYRVTTCCETKQKFYILFTPHNDFITRATPGIHSINNDSIVKCALGILFPLKPTGKGQGAKVGLVWSLRWKMQRYQTWPKCSGVMWLSPIHSRQGPSSQLLMLFVNRGVAMLSNPQFSEKLSQSHWKTFSIDVVGRLWD